MRSVTGRLPTTLSSDSRLPILPEYLCTLSDRARCRLTTYNKRRRRGARRSDTGDTCRNFPGIDRDSRDTCKASSTDTWNAGATSFESTSLFVCLFRSRMLCVLRVGSSRSWPGTVLFHVLEPLLELVRNLRFDVRSSAAVCPAAHTPSSSRSGSHGRIGVPSPDRPL